MNSWIIISHLMIDLYGPADIYRNDTTTLARPADFKKHLSCLQCTYTNVKQGHTQVRQQVKTR
jgi:hypothetical protein